MKYLPCLLLLALALPARAATFSYQKCAHAAQFAAYVKTIRPEYLNATQTHWVVVEYPAAKWPLACKIYGATGDPLTFTGVSFLTTHIVLIEDTGGTSALGTFIHETGHIVFWPALSNITFAVFGDSIDAVFQHEYDVLGRDTMPTDEAVQEAWCEELRQAETPGAGAALSPWGKVYFPQLFSPSAPVPPLMPVPDNYITPPTDDVPPTP